MTEERKGGAPPPAPEQPAESIVPSEASPPGGVPDLGMSSNTWAMACHLSALLGFVFPFGNFIAPLVIWMVKKDTMPEVDRHGKEALNFQISLTIFVVVATAISLILMLVVVGVLTLILTLIAWAVMGIVFPIIAGLKANEGKAYQYPCTIRFIK